MRWKMTTAGSASRRDEKNPTQDDAKRLSLGNALRAAARAWGLVAGVVGCALSAHVHAALGDAPMVSAVAVAGGVPLVQEKMAAPFVVDANDHPGVLRAARDVQADIERVTHVRPSLRQNGFGEPSLAAAVIVGTLGRSAPIDELVRSGKVDASAVTGRWEAFLLQVVEQPFPGVERALVIAGSDKRGTIYGLYELSEQIGVSPWAWWADVPVSKRDALHVFPVRRIVGEPAVKYRGIFLNDEAPALSGWAREKFGGLNSRFYTRVFELLLRLRANYLWPAMWDNAFNEDDPENARLADEYGIVMGTSHHEPMLRSQREWHKHGSGPWDYARNGETLRKFWADGIRRNRAFESLVTIGMRGDGDEPMSEAANVALLEKIVADQRAILKEAGGADPARVPQLWALYKEVQEYYEKGMRVPDDVTLLWCDDNWGNLRRVPTAAERGRTGGAGIYYHFDYVGGPRSYKWLNTVPLPKIWEQLHLGWRHGADRIWIVNVGDLKPMEFPMEFFLRYAWSPARWPHERLEEFSRLWATREFGAEHANEIAALVGAYTKFNGRRKPELLTPDTYSLIHYREAETVVGAWRDLAARAGRVAAALRPEAGDAFHQLVLHPVKACAIVNELHVTAGLNQLYAVQGRTATNTLAERARALFREDEALTRYWNESFAGGRWRHLMDQTHLGYTYWQQPQRNVMPAVVEVQVPDAAELGVAVEGSSLAWPSHDPFVKPPVLPEIDAFARQTRWIEVFNRGRAPLTYSLKTSVPWLRVRPGGRDETNTADARLDVSVDWAAAVPRGETKAVLTINGSDGRTVVVTIPVRHPQPELLPERGSFVESDDHVAIEAQHFSRAIGDEEIRWETLADFGRTKGGVTAFPVTAPRREIASASPHLEYDVHLFTPGEVKVELVVAPTLEFLPGRKLSCAVSFDDAVPQFLAVAPASLKEWERAVSDAATKLVTKHRIAKPGRHTLKFWLVDPGVVLQRVVIDCGGVKPSYLGPPESPRLDAPP